MSMPKPVSNMATAVALGPPGSRRRRRSTPGCTSWMRNHPPPESVFRRARHGRSLRRCGELAFRTLTRHRARTRSLEGSRSLATEQPGSGAQNRPACPAMAATRRLRAVPPQRSPSAMVPGAPAVLEPAGHIDPVHMARLGWRSPRSPTAIIGHIVFGSNNFRSPIVPTSEQRRFGVPQARHCPYGRLDADPPVLRALARSSSRSDEREDRRTPSITPTKFSAATFGSGTDRLGLSLARLGSGLWR